MTLWESVNVKLDPNLKDDLLKQRLNVFFCEKCEWSGSVDVSMLYHDMEKGFCVQYVAKEDMKSPEFYRSITKQGTLQLDPISVKIAPEYLKKPHYVFSMKEVILYVAFRDLCEVYGVEETNVA